MNSFKNFIKENYITILLFFFFISILIIVFQKSNQDKIDTHLATTQKIYTTQYKRVYDSFDKLSQNTFYGILNKPEIYDNVKKAYKQNSQTQKYYRDKLYNLFLSDYTRLVNFDFKQLHFHFPDATSFLRMHKPKKFGDNLTTIRDSVVKVNKTFKPIQGFEMGRVIHGFRFVYPLSDTNLNHIGSVEVSVSSEYFQNYYERYYDVDVHFLTKKDIVTRKMFKEELKHQVTSEENENYFTTSVDNSENENEILHSASENLFLPQEQKMINEKMALGDTFIIKKKIESNYTTISFLPIANIRGVNNSAYLVIYTKSDYLQQLEDNFLRFLVIVFLIIVIFFLFLSQKYKKNQRDKKKYEMISQQSKMASMGEMIGNIAHQWRQPLSVISTAATGMKVQKEFNILTDEMFYNSVDHIAKSTEYLSQTIEDFRNFFNTKKEKTPFSLQTVIEESLKIFGTSFNTKNIIIVQNIEDVTIISYKNELKQILINLFKNALDAIKEDGLIMIDSTVDKNEIILKVQDSGTGIPSDVIKRIFEPYFTTKHQSVGTGLGLYMSHEIIDKSFHGTIEVKNNHFNYNFKEYYGACFIITINKEKL